MIVCPYKTYRYHRPCSITVAHFHARVWADMGRAQWVNDAESVMMFLSWWLASRARRAG